MTSSAKTVVITPKSNLLSALADARGGDTILLAGGDYGALELWDQRDKFIKYEDEVTIRSLDAADPASFSRVVLNGADNMTFDGIVFDYTSATKSWDKYKPFEVKSSSNIIIKNSIFDGDVGKNIGNILSDYGTGMGLTVGGSENITVEDNLFFDWARAASFGGVSNLTVSGNEVRSVRSDGFNFVGVVDAEITENWLHSFARAPGAGDHADMIQFWTLNTVSPSRNVTISQNVLDSAGVSSTQSIFMRNEAVDVGRRGLEMFYENILIENNVIRNAHSHGITVGEAKGVVIRNNTLLQDAAAGDGGGVTEPAISVAEKSLGVTITGNIAHRIGGGGIAGWVVEDNLIVQRKSANLDNFYDDLFVNARADGRAGVEALRALPGGEVETLGVGADATRFDVTPTGLDGYILVADGGAPGLTDRAYEAVLYGSGGRIDLSKATVLWTFEGGAAGVAGGASATHSFSAPGEHMVAAAVRLADGRTVTLTRAESLTPAIAHDVSFEGSADDSAWSASPVHQVSKVAFKTVDGRSVAQADGGFIRWLPDDEMRYAASYEVSVDFAKATAADKGVLLTFPGVFSIIVGADHITGTISTSEGGGRMVANITLGEMEWRTVSLKFSSEKGEALLSLDGVEIGRLDGLTGGVSSGANQYLQMGDVRGNSFNGYVDHIVYDVTGEAADGPSGPTDGGGAVGGDGGGAVGGDGGTDGVTPEPVGSIVFSQNALQTVDRVQDRGGAAMVSDDGSSVRLGQNSWKKVAIDMLVTEDTILTFDFASGREAEIHSIGVWDGVSPIETALFKVLGSQDYGVLDFDGLQGAGDAARSYEIPLGDYFTGEARWLVMLTDDDHYRGGDSIFSNIALI